MTQPERDKIDHLRELIEDHVLPQIQEIRRGVYGDQANGVKGLIQRQDEDEKRLENLEDFRKKLVWIGTAFIVAAQLAWGWIKEKLW